MIFGTPIDQYYQSDSDLPGGTNYYGFIGPRGAWYIAKETISGTLTAFTYISGGSDYATNWTNRALLTYAQFDSVFKW